MDEHSTPSPPHMGKKLPKRISDHDGRFLLGRILGTGSFSEVKLAVHTVTKLELAMKILNQKRIEELGTKEMVQREIDHLRICGAHPHLVRLYDVLEAPTNTCLVMEFASGGELHEYIQKQKSGRLPVSKSRSYFQQITSAIEYMHYKNVVHRDLSLDNILLDSTFRIIKIADLGLSNLVREGEFMHTPCGSPFFSAPEIISGKPYAGPGVDVWSCGVILYTLLCGCLPFHENSMSLQFKKIKSGTYNLPKHLSKEAQSLIKKMLVVSTVERITISAIRLHPWFQRQLLPNLQIFSNTIELKGRKAVDSDVIDQVLKLYSSTITSHPEKVTRELLERAVTLEDGSSDNDNIQDLRCAYEIILDKKHERKYANEDSHKKLFSWLGRAISIFAFAVLL